jgi:hypothetical protein
MRLRRDRRARCGRCGAKDGMAGRRWTGAASFMMQTSFSTGGVIMDDPHAAVEIGDVEPAGIRRGALSERDIARIGGDHRSGFAQPVVTRHGAAPRTDDELTVIPWIDGASARLVGRKRVYVGEVAKVAAFSSWKSDSETCSSFRVVR